MSESALGFSVAATRQTAGRSAKGLAAGPGPPPRAGGGGIAPAATSVADVIVTFVSATLVSAAHDSADGAAVCASRDPIRSATRIDVTKLCTDRRVMEIFSPPAYLPTCLPA
jgi:hypothetical protein